MQHVSELFQGLLLHRLGDRQYSSVAVSSAAWTSTALRRWQSWYSAFGRPVGLLWIGPPLGREPGRAQEQLEPGEAQEQLEQEQGQALALPLALGALVDQAETQHLRRGSEPAQLGLPHDELQPLHPSRQALRASPVGEVALHPRTPVQYAQPQLAKSRACRSEYALHRNVCRWRQGALHPVVSRRPTLPPTRSVIGQQRVSRPEHQIGGQDLRLES